MANAQLEQRVSTLEKTVEELKAQLSRKPDLVPSRDPQDAFPSEDDLIAGAEYPVVLSKPPTEVIRLRGIIREIRPGRQDLGLSDAEIALFSEEEDE